MGKLDEARTDLSQSLELSKGTGHSAAQAYVQLALIHRLNGEEEFAKVLKIIILIQKNSKNF